MSFETFPKLAFYYLTKDYIKFTNGKDLPQKWTEKSIRYISTIKQMGTLTIDR